MLEQLLLLGSGEVHPIDDHLETARPCSDEGGAVAPREAGHRPGEWLPSHLLAAPPIPHHQRCHLCLRNAGQVLAWICSFCLSSFARRKELNRLMK